MNDHDPSVGQARKVRDLTGDSLLLDCCKRVTAEFANYRDVAPRAREIPVDLQFRRLAELFNFWSQTAILRDAKSRQLIPADTACHFHGNILGGFDLQQIEGAAMQFGRRETS